MRYAVLSEICLKAFRSEDRQNLDRHPVVIRIYKQMVVIEVKCYHPIILRNAIISIVDEIDDCAAIVRKTISSASSLLHQSNLGRIVDIEFHIPVFFKYFHGMNPNFILARL